MHEFNIGDRVICVSAAKNLTLGKQYEVLNVNTMYLTVQDDLGHVEHYLPWRFEKLNTIPEKTHIKEDDLLKQNILSYIDIVQKVEGNPVILLDKAFETIETLSKNGVKIEFSKIK